MRKFLFKSFMVLAALTFAWGCGSSSDDPDPVPVVPTPTDSTEVTPPPTPPASPWVEVATQPMWDIDWNATDERPDWKDPDFSDYENWMIVMVKMPELLSRYISPDDMMAVFINGELRGLSSVATEFNRDESGIAQQSTYFIIKVYSNATKEKTETIGFKYYSSELHHLFAVEDTDPYIPEGELGVSSDYEPPILKGSSKYPILTTLTIKFQIDQTVEEPFVAAPLDFIGAFVGDECRGTAYVGQGYNFTGYITVPLYSKEVGEPITLRYYSSIKNAVRVFQISGTTKQGLLMNTIKL